MPDLKQKFGTSAALTITIASLTNTSGRASTAIDNTSTLAISADIEVKIKTGASSTSATGYVEVWLVSSPDGTTYDDSFAGSDAAYTPVNAKLLGYIAVAANATTYVGSFDTAMLGLTLPKKWAIGIVNKTGGTLDSTGGNHEIRYTEKTMQSV